MTFHVGCAGERNRSPLLSTLFAFAPKVLSDATPMLLCGMNIYSFRLCQKLFSIPLTHYQQQRPKHLRVWVGWLVRVRGIEAYSFSTPFGQIVSFHSQSDSKAFRFLTKYAPSIFLHSAQPTEKLELLFA